MSALPNDATAAAVSGDEDVDLRAFDVIEEGSARILAPKGEKVFYNNVQVVNRDLSVAVLSAFEEVRSGEVKAKLEAKRQRKFASGEPVENGAISAPGLKVLEALSATGLRSVRYYNEVPNIQSVVVNDVDAAAVQSIRRNIAYNRIAADTLVPNHGDAIQVMYANQRPDKLFDVIDLDPYGSANVFVDSAMGALANGGLLCVTCTDLAVLAGSKPFACFAKYGVMPHRAKYCHEMALRILLSFLQTSAGRHGRYIVPLLSASIDFYVRVFVRVFKNKEEAWNSATRLSHVYQCCGCDAFYMQPLARSIAQKGKAKTKLTQARVATQVGSVCGDCGNAFKIAGPFWSDAMHDVAFVARVKKIVEEREQTEQPFAARKRLVGLLTAVEQELPHAPLYYDVASLCNTLRCNTPPAIKFKSALLHAGYEVSSTHCSASAVKTSAPPSVVWDVMRAWVALNPVKARSDACPAAAILAKAPAIDVDFSAAPGASTKGRVPVFLPNPQPNWGPKSRARANGKRLAAQNDDSAVDAKRAKPDDPAQ